MMPIKALMNSIITNITAMRKKSPASIVLLYSSAMANPSRKAPLTKKYTISSVNDTLLSEGGNNSDGIPDTELSSSLKNTLRTECFHPMMYPINHASPKKKTAPNAITSVSSFSSLNVTEVIKERIKIPNAVQNTHLETFLDPPMKTSHAMIPDQLYSFFPAEGHGDFPPSVYTEWKRFFREGWDQSPFLNGESCEMTRGNRRKLEAR